MTTSKCTYTHYLLQAAKAEPMLRKLLEAKRPLADDILKGGSMSLIAITNPSDESAESGIVYEAAPFETFTPNAILNKFGSKLEDGAQVTMVEGNRVWQYLATRDGSSIALRSNNALAADAGDQDEDSEFFWFVTGRSGGSDSIIDSTVAPLELPEAELETFTVYGNNDDDENFVAVVSATEETAHEVGVAAGVVDKGYENDVKIYLILKGDQTDLATVSI